MGKLKPGFRLSHLPAVGFMAVGVAGLSAQIASAPNVAQLPKPTADQATFFETKVRPVLAEKCLPCHGKTSQLGGLRLDSAAALLKGGDDGPILVPGDPDKSKLILAVRQTGSLKMPQGGKLAANEISDLEAWVKMGAPWPAEGSAKAEVPTLWSLQPVTKPAAPKVKDGSWVKNPIDAFVLRNLEAKGISPAPPADRRTLIRRVTYDLTGLPPTPEEVDSFLADKSPDAYGKVVDRLLDSPHYGERWARHWLDVARYADTKGYVFNEDRAYPNAYTYRDWVIKAINRDLPYDQFITDQLAADRLPKVQDGSDKSDLAALGFLTVGRRFLNQVPDIIDDRIDVTMRGIEGFTVACARCHDHKFDPIPTQDYYSLYAVFNSSSEAMVPISPPAVSGPWEEYNRELSAETEKENGFLRDQVKRLRAEKDDPEQSKGLSQPVKAALQALNPNDLPSGAALTTLSGAFDDSSKAELASLQSGIKQLESKSPALPEFAMAMADKPDPKDGVVFKRGNPGSPGEVAPRRFLAALTKPGVERDHWTTDSGRLELARSIVSRDNPLTARVFVNRAWLHHFGAGIVRTPSDFGHQGEPPTDPKLLDYLAATFMEDGWSMKKLHRLIVTSATYRQSSSISPATFNADPDNRLWSRMNRQRLDLEEMRDSVEEAAGSLDLKDVGGKSVDIWSQPFTPRRAVYGYVERQNLPGIFRTFDFATPDSTSPKRFVTTVPQQALFFMNSPFVVDAARESVNRPEISRSSDPVKKIHLLYRELFDRYPSAEETAIGLSYLGSNPEEVVDSPANIWQYGFGGFDPSSKRTNGFKALDNYYDSAYHPAAKFPDSVLGYLMLNQVGGHPGRDGQHCAIRRWIAPADLDIQVEGTLSHRQSQGDGVLGRIVSSRSGELGNWDVHNRVSPTNVDSVHVAKGETIDFIVDPKSNDGYDAFGWTVDIQSKDGKLSWKSNDDFGPKGAAVDRLTLYAQALMMTNEFMFVD